MVHHYRNKRTLSFSPDGEGVTTRIITEVVGSEIKLFFDPKLFCPNKYLVVDTINAYILSGDCIGADLSRFFMGEIMVFFNPILHRSANRHEVVRAIKAIICMKKPCLVSF